MRQLAPSVYAYIQSKGSWFWSNAGLIVGREYALVVDSLATVDLTQKFVEEVREVTDRPVRYLINTHHHGDHIWANHLFTEADIVCQARCGKEALKTGIMDPDMLGMTFPGFNFHGIAVTPPDITFEKQLSFHLDDRQVQLIYYGPAHTVGDIIVYLPQESIVFGGDLLFLYSTPLAMQGSFTGWIEVMDAMANLNARTFVPGHGPVCGREGVVECREYLELVREEGRKRLDEGMSVDAAARDIDLGRFKKWANWERILANMERLKRELQGQEPDSEVDGAELVGRMNALGASI
jgi:glyoxylase-like metal-dependent hydrolase (beta-lactamase superfamily II)